MVGEQLLQEVEVRSVTGSDQLFISPIGSEQIPLARLAHTPALLGERDVMRSLQLLPGVKAESDLSSGFQVRGGTAAQNAVLLDGMPVHSAGHLAGLFSAFNDDALGSATLYKGAIPAGYGDASSSVLEVIGRSGHSYEWHGGASVGLLAAKGSIEGPIVPGRASFLLTARRSYMDALLQPFDFFRGNTLYFYDVNAKADWRVGEGDRVIVTAFNALDETALAGLLRMRWRDLSVGLQWQHQYAEGADAQTAAYYSAYGTENGTDLSGMTATLSGHVRQGGLRHVYHRRTPLGSVDLGGQSVLYDVKTGEWQKGNSHEQERRRAWQNSVWVDADVTLWARLSLSAGVRGSVFSALGGTLYYGLDADGNIIRLYRKGRHEVVKNYLSVEPRLHAVVRLTPLSSLKAGYTRASQHLHTLRSQNISTPFDRVTLSSNLIRPELSDQVSLGWFGTTPSGGCSLSAEVYYRTVRNVLDYRDGKNFEAEIELERLVLPARGRSYGLELCARRDVGRLTGWIAYTLAWSQMHHPQINGGRWYDASNDRRHDVDVVGLFQLNSRWTLGAVWGFQSGQAFTAPDGKYVVEDNYIYYYSERNGYRTPPYHRLDVSATWSGPAGGRLSREWVFGIYNLYNHYNPLFIRFKDGVHGAQTRAVQYSLFGIVPSVSFHIKF